LAGATWCDYCHRLSIASWPAAPRPTAAPDAAVAVGGKLLLALVGGMFGFALVASNGLLGLLGVLLLYTLGLCVGAAVDARRSSPVGEGLLVGLGRLPQLPTGLRYGGYLRLARRATSQIDHVVRFGPLPARRSLADLPRRAAALEHRIRDMARAGDSIRRYLAARGRVEAEARERNLRLRLRTTQDPVARAHFEQALRALDEENAVYDRMRAALERVEAQIAHASFALSCTQSKVSALAAGPDVSGISSDALSCDLDALTRELSAFDAALNEVLELGVVRKPSEADEEPI